MTLFPSIMIGGHYSYSICLTIPEPERSGDSLKNRLQVAIQSAAKSLSINQKLSPFELKPTFL